MKLALFSPPALCFVLLAALPLAAEDTSRLAQVRDELATIQSVIAKLPDGRERKKLEERRVLLERESEILKQRQELETREQALTLKQRDNPTARLQEVLRNATLNAPPLQVRLEALDGSVRAIAARLVTLRADRQKLGTAAEGADRAAALDDQILTVSEELEAQQLQREAVTDDLELVRDTEAVATRLHDEPAIVPLHVKTWWERRRELEERTRRLAEAEQNNLTVTERRKAAEDALALAKEKMSRIDEEIALLAPQTSFFRSTPGVDRLLAAARRDKEAVGTRLPHLETQHTALVEAENASNTSAALIRAQVDWLRERQTLLTDRYLRWLAWPVAAVTTLLVLFIGASRLLLPWLYKNEMLVSARRVNRYAMFATITMVLALFFFEDLQVIATTLGIVSAALVIALQDVFTSLAGWFALIASRKIHIGDRVQIDGEKGDVIEIELFRTTLLEVGDELGFEHPTGRIIVLPNSYIFRSRVHNASYGHHWVWIRTDITVTYETPVPEAAALLRRIIEEETAPEFVEARRDSEVMTERFGRADAEYVPKIYCTAGDSGIVFSLVSIADCRHRTAMKDRLHRRIIAEFARDPRMQFAYPTHRTILSRDFVNKPPAPTGAAPAAPARAEPTSSAHLSAFPDGRSPTPEPEPPR